MAKRKPIVPDDVQLEMDQPFIVRAVQGVVEGERGRGWAFKNEGGRYERQDALDRLFAAGQITHVQHQAGKRYGRQYSAAYEYGRCVSTLEFRRSDHALTDGGIQAAIYLGQAQAAALARNARLIAAMAAVCERQTTISDLIGLRAALTRLVDYYADLEDESEEIEAPASRTLRDRAADLAAAWEGSNLTGARRYHHVPDRIKRLVWEAQNGRCSLCGSSVEADGATLEHVVPLSRGGLDGPGNLCAAHRSCNERKGSSLPSRFALEVLASVNEILGWCEEVAEPTAAERIASALARAADPGPVPKSRPRHIHTTVERAPTEALSHLEKPTRSDKNMRDTWLADQGVVRSNRSMRTRSVNAVSRRGK